MLSARMYVEGFYYTRVPFVQIGSLPPPPLLQASFAPPPPPPNQMVGGQHSRAGEGRGEPIQMTGKKAWHSVNSVA
jgi:hypothetical protein